MAESKVVFEVQVTAKGMKQLQKQLKDTNKETKKTAENTDKATKSTDKFDKQNKALYQSNLSSAKGFSKMNQTIGSDGSSGLVGAYATLAANVFAATAAFNALKRAAQIDVLIESLAILGAQSGQNLGLLADGLRDAAGGAIDLAQAMQTASVGASAGFDASQIEGLAKVAKMAALALGRDVGDAVDRLTRGAAKLEPEILDELGIFVRLDDAADKYASSIGKTANELTRFEKRQAFANDILEQGQAKFGALEDLDASAFDRLGATLLDLAKTVTTFFNAVLGPLAGFLAENKLILAGLFAVITKGIMNQALPMLNEFAKTSERAAKSELARAHAVQRRSNKEIQAQRALLKPVKNSELNYNKLLGTIKQGHASVVQMVEAEISLKRSIVQRQRKLLTGNKETLAARQRELEKVKEQRRELNKLIKMENARRKQDIAALQAGGRARFKRSEQAVFRELDKDQSFKGYMRAFGLARQATNKYKRNLGAARTSNQLFGISFGFLGKAANAARPAIAGFGLTAKIAIKGIFTAIPVIGQILIVIDLLIIGIKKLGQFIGGMIPEASEFTKANRALKTSLDFVEESQTRLALATKNASEEFKISGTATQGLVDAMDRQAKATKEAEKNSNMLGKAFQAVGNVFRFVFAIIGAVFDGFGLGIKKMVVETELAIAEMVIGAKGNMEGLINLINKILERAGVEPIEVFSEEDAARVESLRKELTEVERLQKQTLDVSTVTFFGPGAIAETKEMQSVLKGSGEAAKELATFIGVDNMNDFAESLRQISSFDDLPDNLNKIAKAVDANGDGFLNTSEKAEFLRQALREGTAETREIGQAVVELQGALKEGNQKLSEFLNGFTKKGAINAFSGTVQGITEQINILGGESKEGGSSFASIVLEIEKANSKLKNGIMSFLPITAERQEQLTDSVEKYNKAIAKGEEPNAQIMADMEEYGKLLKGATNEYEKLVRNIEKAQLFSAATLRNFAQESKALAKFTKENTAALDARIERDNQAQELKVGDLERENKLRKAGNQDLLDRFANESKRAEMTSEELGIVAQIMDAEQTIAEEKEKIIGATEKQALLDQEILSIDIKKLNAAKQIAAEKAKQLVAEQKLASAQSGFGLRQTPAEILKAQIEAQKNAIKFAKREKELNDEKLRVELLIVEARLIAAGIEDSSLIEEIKEGMREVSKIQEDILNQKIKTLEAEEKLIGLSEKGVLNLELQSVKQLEALDKLDTAVKEGALKDAKVFSPEMFAGMNEALEPMRAALKELGPEGELVAMAQEGILSLGVSFMQIADAFKDGGGGMQAAAQAAAQAISVISNLMQANTKAQVHAIDQQIEAEKKRDGKSKESVAKIQAMEKKKEAIQRKAFEQKKKMDIAQAIISTALGVTRALELGPIIGPILAVMQAAMGLAQIAIIKKQTFQGGGGGEGQVQPQKLEIGKRGNTVDVSRGATAGELSYLRGQRGVGTNANNFIAGGAAGMKRGYAAGGDILVGERGPEVIQPTTAGFNVVPNDQLGGTQNINFNISAVDATGIQELLVDQRGNIIEMIREAANDTGEYFLEQVDTQSMGGSGGGYG